MYVTHAGGTGSVPVQSSTRPAPEIGSRKSAVAQEHASDTVRTVGTNRILEPNAAAQPRGPLPVGSRFPFGCAAGVGCSGLLGSDTFDGDEGVLAAVELLKNAADHFTC